MSLEKEFEIINWHPKHELIEVRVNGSSVTISRDKDNVVYITATDPETGDEHQLILGEASPSDPDSSIHNLDSN